MDPFPTEWQTIDDAPKTSTDKPAKTRWDGLTPRIVAAALLGCGVLAVLGVVLVASAAAPSEVVIDAGEVTGLIGAAQSPGGPP
ncbi:MAG: hypothetical protein ABIZ34_10625, partial [Candidatus Limnocylindrales bacterium]